MAGKTVLILDGDRSSLQYLIRSLRNQEYSVIATNSGKEGLVFAWRDRPDIILVDPVLSDIKGEEFIRKLRQDPRTAHTPILALSSDQSQDLEDACLEAGCTEFLLKSSETATILPEVVKRLLGIKPKVQKSKGFLIVFLSAKGGTGTSSLCANYAKVIAENQPDAKIVVADLVLPIGSIAPIVGYDGDLDLVSVAELSSKDTTGNYFFKNLPSMELWDFQLLPGSTDPDRANDLKAERIPEIIDRLQVAYEFVIVDLGRSLSRISLPIIQKADLLVLIMSTDLSTISLTKTVLEYLHSKGIANNSVYAILNRAVGLEGLTKSEAEEIIGFSIKTALPYLGSNFTLANNHNQPLIMKFPTDTASIVLKNTAIDMIDCLGKLRSKR